MLKRKMISWILGIFVISTLSVFTGNAVASEGGNEVTVVAEEDNEVTLAAACRAIEMVYFSKNTITKEVIFKVTGTPGNLVSLNINKFLGGWVQSTYVHLPSSGVEYVTIKIKNGSYELSVIQESPCNDEVNALFFTMTD